MPSIYGAQDTNPEATIIVPLSHFPEAHAMLPIAKRSGTGISIEGIPLAPWQIPGGPIVLRSEQFQKFWKQDFTGGQRFAGLENALGKSLRLRRAFYVVPRRELFRHLDSYGHIGINQWPYNLLNPNFHVDPKSPLEVRESDYTFLSAISPPTGSTDHTVASEHNERDLIPSLAMAVFKSSFLRPSWLSIKWTANSFDGAKPSDVRAAIRLVLMQSPQFRIRLAVALVAAPLHLLIAAIGALVRPFPNLHLNFLWYLTYGSTIGFVRLLLNVLLKRTLRSK